MAHLGPTTASEIGELLGCPASEIEKALLRMEASGAILRGKIPIQRLTCDSACSEVDSRPR